MAQKESIGKALKQAARLLPGIESYQDKESARELDKQVRMTLSRRLDEALGIVEWLKTDQAKKGVIQGIQLLEDLTRHVEKVSRVMEFAPRGYAALFDEWQVDERTLGGLLEFDKAMMGFVTEVEGAIREMAAKGEVPQVSDVARVREQLGHIEKKLKDRERFLGGQKG
jgi:hypothetical protein